MAGDLVAAAAAARKPLEAAAARWVTAAHAAAAHPGPLALPADDAAGVVTDFDALVGHTPGVLRRADDPKVRAAATERLAAVAAEVTAAGVKLRELLADLAFEAAAARTLIVPDDRFDVSAFGVLTAAALANFLHQLRRGGDGDPAKVVRPLALAVARGATRPGDLWVADVAARTVLAARRDDTSLPERTLPKFVAVSLLFKLTGVGRVGPAVAKRAEYKLWPGLAVVLADPGARSVRATLAGELAGGLVGENAGVAQAAFFRFLDALTTADDPARALGGANLTAALLLELLEIDAKALAKLTERGEAAAPLFRAIRAVEEVAEAAAPDGLAEEHDRLTDTRSCLRTFREYAALSGLRRGFGAVVG